MRHNDLSMRVEVMKKLISMAESCQKYSNYNTCFEIGNPSVVKREIKVNQSASRIVSICIDQIRLKCLQTADTLPHPSD